VECSSERFGRISFEETQVLRFPQGLIGFADMKRYIIHSDERIEPLCWLQSLDDPGLAFLVVSPFIFFTDYEVKVRLPKALRAQMGDADDLRVFCIVTAQADFARSTVNLLGPLVYNEKNRNGWQVVLEDDSLSTRHPLFPPAEELEQAQVRVG
jgi:flagellar assembly factor FliW